MSRRGVGVAFILAPLLWLIAAAANAVGIGRNDLGGESWVEGLVAFYGSILFVPVMLTLGAFVGERRPKTGIAISVIGLFSAVATSMPMAARVIQKALTEAGSDLLIWELPGIYLAPIIILAGPFALFLGLTGLALVKDGRVEPWVGWLLVFQSVPFFLAQAAGVAYAITWPLAAAMIFAALAPVGSRILRGGGIARPS